MMRTSDQYGTVRNFSNQRSVVDMVVERRGVDAYVQEEKVPVPRTELSRLLLLAVSL